VNAQGVIDQMETDAFGAPLAAGRPPARFTGKPYDEDMGAYIFPFRNYRPDEARWMTPDPSGFPDGANNNCYAPTPTIGNDPLGLFGIEYGFAGVNNPAIGTTQASNSTDHLAETVTHTPTLDNREFAVQFTPDSSILNATPTPVGSLTNVVGIIVQECKAFRRYWRPGNPPNNHFMEAIVVSINNGLTFYLNFNDVTPDQGIDHFIQRNNRSTIPEWREEGWAAAFAVGTSEFDWVYNNFSASSAQELTYDL
jgi:RHS repeat-associated protein